MLEDLFAIARREGVPMAQIGGSLFVTASALLDALCDETEKRLVVEDASAVMVPCGFIESEGMRVPVSRAGDPRHGGAYMFWIGARDAAEVEDHFDERQRIVSAIRARVPADEDAEEVRRGELVSAFTALCRTRIDLTEFDLEAFAAGCGTPIAPEDPFDVISHAQTRREARRRQRAMHLRGWLDDEYLLEAGRDRARELAALDGPGSRYAKVAEDIEERLDELVGIRRRRMGVSFLIEQRPLDETGLLKAMAFLRIACDDAQCASDRNTPVLDAARRVAAYLPFSEGIPRDIGAVIEHDVDRAFSESGMNVARVAFGALLDLAWECFDDALRTDREAASDRVRALLYEEYDRVKSELGVV